MGRGPVPQSAPESVTGRALGYRRMDDGVDRIAGRGWVAAVMAMACAGCSICCEPTGKLMWSGRLPSGFMGVGQMVDGATGGLSCEAGWK